jgi:hypothetical protein
MTTKNVLPDEVRTAKKSVRYLEMLDMNPYPERQESLHTGMDGTRLSMGNRFWFPFPYFDARRNKSECSGLCPSFFTCGKSAFIVNRLTPNDTYMGRTTPITSKSCILYIYSTNIVTEYFKHALYSQFFLFKMQFVS